MKKIVLGLAILAFSVPAFAAQRSGSLKLIGFAASKAPSLIVLPSLADINALHKGGLFAGKNTLQGLPVGLLTAGFSATSGLLILKSTPVPNILMHLRASLRNGNS